MPATQLALTQTCSGLLNSHIVLLGTDVPETHSSVSKIAPCGLIRSLKGQGGSVLALQMGSVHSPSPRHVAALHTYPGLFKIHDKPSGTGSMASVRQLSWPVAIAPGGTSRLLYRHPSIGGGAGVGISVQCAAVHSPDTHRAVVQSYLAFLNVHAVPCGKICESIVQASVTSSAPTGIASPLRWQGGFWLWTHMGLFHVPSIQIAALHVESGFVRMHPAPPPGIAALAATSQFGCPYALAPAGITRAVNQHPISVGTQVAPVLHDPAMHVAPLHV